MRNNHKKTFGSRMPLRFLLIGMLVADINHITSNINIYIFPWINFPDLTSYNVICQLTSYIFNYFSVLNECFMLVADFILLSFILPKKNINTHEYKDFFEIDSSIDSTKLRPLNNRFSTLGFSKNTELIFIYFKMN
jgi:hypothetical protein